LRGQGEGADSATEALTTVPPVEANSINVRLAETSRCDATVLREYRPAVQGLLELASIKYLR
jgi:hypothetical protein